MKKILLSMMFLFMLVPAVHAEGEEVPAGTTPDSIFYFIDQALEDLDLLLTFDDEAKVEKLIQYAEERLAEAEAMNDEEKQEFIEELILEYMANLDEASDTLLELNEEAAEEQEAELDEALAASEEIAEALPTELFEKLEAKKGQAYIKFSVLKDALGENEADIVALANEHNLGLGELAQIAAGAQMLEQDFLVTLQAVIEAGSVEAYFAEFDLKVSDLVSKGVEMKQEKLQEKLAEAIEAGDENKIRQAEFRINHSIAMTEFKEAKDEIKNRREEILVEYGVEDLDELPEEVKAEVKEELKTLQEEALAAKKSVIEEKKENIHEAIKEIKEAHEAKENNGNSGNNGNPNNQDEESDSEEEDEKAKGYEKIKENMGKGKNK